MAKNSPVPAAEEVVTENTPVTEAEPKVAVNQDPKIPAGHTLVGRTKTGGLVLRPTRS